MIVLTQRVTNRTDEFSENLRFRNKLKKGLISCACCVIL
nr:MAG TPA: hypothetical protein [Caudoviricetes sp.]